MVEDEKAIIEQTTRKCISRLKDVNVTEQQVQSMLSRLYDMKDLKTVMDSLALNVSNFFVKPEQIQDFSDCIKDIMQIDDTAYDFPEALLNQLQKNKETNYTPGNIPIEENHQLISDTLKPLCDKLNELGVDYYVVGALSTFIGTQTPLFRYHGEIDFMIAEKDISKVQEALKDSEYNFSDDRLNNQKRLTPGVGHTQGEHEVIANHKENEFHLGFFLFRREQDNSITVREYFMEENENGEKVPQILERHEPAELVALEYSEELTDFAGTQFRTSTPESVYAKKMSTKHPKDMLDLEALRDKVDFDKIKEMEQYDSTLQVVDPDIRQTSRPQYLYHHTRVADLKSILAKGLEVRNGVQSQAVKDPKTKVFFSEGMEGAIAMASAFQHKFDYMKTGTEWEDKTLEDFLEERVFLRFPSDGIENESDKGDFAFSDGWTSQGIAPEQLKVCLLKNIKTGEISYQRDDILKYMLAVNPIENFKGGNERHKEEIRKYYEERSEELAEFDINEYSLQDMDLEKFFEQYIAKRKEPITPSATLSKQSLFSPQEIGKATVNTPTLNKDKAKSQIQRDEPILQQAQEIEDNQLK